MLSTPSATGAYSPSMARARLFRTSCAKIAAHHTISEAVSKLHLHLTPILYPHKPHHPTTKKLPSVCQPPCNIPPAATQRGSNATNTASSPPPHAREQRDQRTKVKTPRGGGLGVVVWLYWKPCEDAGT